jgi:hypothetical protein
MQRQWLNMQTLADAYRHTLRFALGSAILVAGACLSLQHFI